MGFLDVGGGLGIDYDGSRSATAASTNYSLQNYANDVVATVKECCEPSGVPVPTLVSESGRALASHFSVLVFDILGTGAPDERPERMDDDPLILRNLHETFDGISTGNPQEAWNDVLKFKDDALSAFRLGYLSLPERARANNWPGLVQGASIACCPPMKTALMSCAICASLASTYYGNFSVFRSAPDTWAIDQLFRDADPSTR